MTLSYDYKGIKAENIKLSDLVSMCRALPRNQYVDMNTPQDILIPTKIVWLNEEVLELMRSWLEFKTGDFTDILIFDKFKRDTGEELVDILHFVASIADILQIDLAKAFLSKYKRNMRRKPTTFTSKEKKGKAKKERYYDLQKDYGLHT